MRATLSALLLAGVSVSAAAQSDHYVRPHVDKNGNFVQGHMQTNPDGNRMNNWSTQGNVNPYTGQPGTVNPYNVPQPRYQAAPSYQQPRQQVCGRNVYGQYVCQ